jgi:hypothetical protein
VIEAVVFDVGETLLDDTREFNAWADWIGVPRHTFSALIGIVVAQGRNSAEAFQYVQPGFELTTERRRRERAGLGEKIEDHDLYPDVRPTLAELRRRGLWVGVAGNQTERAAALLRALNLPVDDIATSGEWGVAKPDPEFFRRVVDFAPGQPHERQKLITEGRLKLVAVMDEAVLHRQIGGPQVMYDQLSAMLEAAKQWNVSLQVIPFWRKSTRSGSNGQCVEARRVDDTIQVRDSKDQTGPVLTFTLAEWDAFTGGAKDGEFDL